MTRPASISVTMLLGMLALFTGCGGPRGGTTTPTPTPTVSPTPTPTPVPQNPPPGTTVGGTANAPIVVPLGQGATVANINISVPAPALNPVLNVQSLGAGTAGTSINAFGTGTTISRGAAGTTQTVILFGPGLSTNGVTNLTVRVGGPADITVGPPSGITSTKGTPGVAFTVAVGPTTSLGARTVFLTAPAPNNDITVFAGGLEIIP